MAVKVLALVTDAFGGLGGIACYNREFLSAVANDTHVSEVHVIPRNGTPLQVGEKLRQLEPCPDKFRYSIAAFREARRFRPDQIFCGHLYMLPLAVLIGRWLRRPVWLQLHGIEAWASPSNSVQRAISRVDFVTCVSRYSRRRFLAWSGLEPSRIHVLPNTVDPRFQPGAPDKVNCRAEYRRQFGFGSDPVLLTVGRLATSERYKGQDRVLRCLPELRRVHPGIKYVIAGGGDDQVRLAQIAEELEIADAVRFFGDVDSVDLPRLYEAADLFVMPSTGEGFGIVYLEAMACGTPALGLSGDGSSDPLRDGDLGHIAMPETLCADIIEALGKVRPESLSARVHTIFGRAAYREQLHALLLRQHDDWDSRLCAV